MNTSLDEALVVVEHLDFDIICDIVRMSEKLTCDKKATWLVTLRCCATEYYACDGHRKQALKTLKTSPRVHCDECGYIWTPGVSVNVDWTKL